MFRQEIRIQRRYLSLYLPRWPEEIAKLTSSNISAESSFRALYSLALRLLSFSPFVGLEKELVESYSKKLPLCRRHFGIILDISGTEKLYKTSAEPGQSIISRLARFGITTRVGVANTIGAAWGLSRFGAGCLNLLDGNLEELKYFPIEAARLQTQSIAALHELGLLKIEQLLTLPRASLPIRFGEEILLRLDQLFGRVDEVFDLISPLPACKVSKLFTSPLEREAEITSVTFSLIEELTGELRKQKRRASTYVLKVSGYAANGQRFVRKKEILLITPTQDTAGLISILRSIVESLSIPGGVDQVTLVALDSEKFHNQDAAIFPSFESEIQDVAIEQLVNSFTARLGSSNLREVNFHQSYIPEKTYSFKAIERGSLHQALVPVPIIRAERPSFILEQPYPLEAISLLPDSPPAQIIWKGKKLRISRGVGPERISDEWWCAELGVEVNGRDYFKLQDEVGRWLWVYREIKSSLWFLHGIWA